MINYETGGKDDDNIEEAEFDIHYIHYDRYGFVHDLRLNENKRQSAFEKKWLDKEKSREEKWITMVTDVRKWFTIGDKGYQKMEERIWKVRVSLQSKERTLLTLLSMPGGPRQDERNGLEDLVECGSSQTEAAGYF